MKEYSCSRSNFEANVASSYDRIIAPEHDLSIFSLFNTNI
jgi:hypothetical protein